MSYHLRSLLRGNVEFLWYVEETVGIKILIDQLHCSER